VHQEKVGLGKALLDLVHRELLELVHLERGLLENLGQEPRVPVSPPLGLRRIEKVQSRVRQECPWQLLLRPLRLELPSMPDRPHQAFGPGLVLFLDW